MNFILVLLISSTNIIDFLDKWSNLKVDSRETTLWVSKIQAITTKSSYTGWENATRKHI